MERTPTGSLFFFRDRFVTVLIQQHRVMDSSPRGAVLNVDHLPVKLGDDRVGTTGHENGHRRGAEYRDGKALRH